jgi:DNA-binding transcriptional MerR regulator
MTMTDASGGTRAHLSIGEVLSMLQPEFPDVTISKIRFLESQGLLDPERTPSGYRKFYDADLARLRWILTQQRDHFLPLKVIKERLAADPTGGEPLEGSETEPDAEAVVIDEARAPVAAPAPAAAVVQPPGDDATIEPPPVAPVDRAALAEALDRRAAQRQVLDAGPSDATFSTTELAAAAGLADRDVEQLASFGLIEGRTIGREVIFDGDALVVARLAAAFREHGLEARHLRMFKVAAEKEAGLYQQLVAPIARLRDAESRARVNQRVGELADLGQAMQAALLRHAVRGLTGR